MRKRRKNVSVGECIREASIPEIVLARHYVTKITMVYIKLFNFIHNNVIK